MALTILAGVLPAGVAWCGPAEEAPRWGLPGPARVAVACYDWRDEVRQRDVPVKVYYPVEGAGPLPVVIISHGLGGSRDNYEYLGRHLASHGYVAVHLQHKGSDRDIWLKPQGSLRERARQAVSLANSLHRPLDLRFALKRLDMVNREEPPLKGRLNLERVGAVGHSYGAYTVLAAAGMSFPGPLGRRLRLAEPRVKAVIAMSSPVPPDKSRLAQTYGNIRIPSLHMTGTRDDSLVSGTKAADRRLPYDQMDKADQYLITFEGGDHLIFSGRPAKLPGGENDARFQALICLAATAFLDAYIKEDQVAREWLMDGGLAKALGRDATLEMKIPKPPVPPGDTEEK